MIDDDEIIEEEDGGGDAWLISYADMMTLIACFFILMMAFANYDPAGFNKKAKELSKAFNDGKFKPSEVPYDQISEEIANHPDLKKKLKMTVKNSDLIITFSGSVIFNAGSSKLKDEIMPALDTLVDIIRTRNPNYKVVIEGHADAFEHRKSKKYSSAWELSALRATSVLSRFEFYGFDPEKLVAIAKGDSNPLLPNVDDDGNPIKENLQENRRVMIKVIEPKIKNKQVKFGFGIYFNE